MFVISFSIFAALVVIFIILKNLSFIKANPKYVMILQFTFYLSIILNHFFFSYYGVSASACGEPQFGSTMIHMLPWLFFFIILAIIKAVPSWKSPFSNTLGYGVLHLPFINIKSLFLKMLKKNSSSDTIQQIISAPSLIINSITSENFDAMYKEMKGSIFNSSVGVEDMKKLRNLVDLKDDIGVAVWMLLSGALATVLSHSGIARSECNNSEKYMRQQMNKGTEIANEVVKENKSEKYTVED
jgi:hypothetical protein